MSEIREFLERNHIPMDTSGHGKNRPGWINVRCPECGKWPYLGINVSRLYSFCWSCGPVRLERALHALTGQPIERCREAVGERPGRDYGHDLPHTGVYTPPAGIGPLKPIQAAYLRSRGFSPAELAKLWGIQGCSQLSGRLAWFVFIPVVQDSKLVSWTARRIVRGEPRYLSAPDRHSAVPITDCVYGIDYCRAGIVLTEGPTKVWRVGPGAGALLGLRVSAAQMRRLAEIPVRAILFDREPPAQERARKLARDLSVLPGVTHNLVLETAADPADADQDEIDDIRRRYLM